MSGTTENNQIILTDEEISWIKNKRSNEGIQKQIDEKNKELSVFEAAKNEEIKTKKAQIETEIAELIKNLKEE